MAVDDLKEAPPKRKGFGRRATVRSGRPPKELAGEVDERILNAARQVFLQRGFDGASMEEIAEVARSGKRTIYARFRDKAELFNAVVKRDVLCSIAQYHGEVPTTGTTEERFVQAGIALVHWTLNSDRMKLMRLAIAEVQRFPDLASTVSRTARELSTELGARFLREMTQSSELSTLRAFAPEHLTATARFFLDLVVVPILLRALFEVDLEALDAEIGPHVAQSAAFFLAACRQGGAA